MNAVAVLAHHMDSNAQLGEESLARLETAVRLHERNPFDLFLTTGWDYREDCSRMIGTVMAERLEADYGIDKSQIIVDVNSRDTVGDAYFLRKNAIVPLKIQNLVVVTSDYHVHRTEAIFRAFHPADVDVRVVGADTGLSQDEDLSLHEARSLTAFHRTFSDVDFSDDGQVFRALRTKHPFYNGEIYEQLKIPLQKS